MLATGGSYHCCVVGPGVAGPGLESVEWVQGEGLELGPRLPQIDTTGGSL